MINKVIKKIWQITPRTIRLKAVRFSQNKYTASVAAVVFNEKNEVLLLKHLLRSVNSWGFPGGFMNYGESPEEAIKREICEETGLEIEKIKLLRVRAIKRHIEILFRAEARGSAEIKSREITDLDWFEPDKLPEDMSNVQKSFVKNVIDSEF